MEQSPSFLNDDKPTHKCGLSKVIYGWNQTSQEWYNSLRVVILLEHLLRRNTMSH